MLSKHISSRRDICVIFGSRKGHWWKRCHGMAGLKVRPGCCPFGKKQWTCIETWIYHFESLLPCSEKCTSENEQILKKICLLIFNLCSLQPSASTSIIRERVWRPEPQLTLQRDQTSLATRLLSLCFVLWKIFSQAKCRPRKLTKRQEASEALQKTANDTLILAEKLSDQTASTTQGGGQCTNVPRIRWGQWTPRQVASTPETWDFKKQGTKNSKYLHPLRVTWAASCAEISIFCIFIRLIIPT